MSRAAPAAQSKADDARSVIEFADNRLLKALLGAHDSHLARIEQWLDIEIRARGNRLSLIGKAESRALAETVLNGLYDRLRRGEAIGAGEVDGAVRMAKGPRRPSGSRREAGESSLEIRAPKRTIAPRSPGQAIYLERLRESELVFGLGPAGTGKTYLAVAMGVSMLLAGEVERIILSRPAVEAGERLGFLPGDMREKIDPYLQPLYDALYDMLPGDHVARRLETGEVEIAPLAFMRGRTLSNAFAILDEAQNTTPVQMKMFLTRLGENSRMVVAGDPSQVDLPRGSRSGLVDAVETLAGAKGVAVVRLGQEDVVRHSLVTRILEAYDRASARQRKSGGRKKTDRDD